MPEKSQRKMTEEVHQAVLGIPGTDERGMVYDIKELTKQVRKQNGRVTTNTIYRNIIVGIGGTAITALALHLVGVY